MTSRLISRVQSILGSSSSYHTSSCCHTTVRERFRMSLGLVGKTNKSPELQNYPDYSFIDGRPTPLTPAQLRQVRRNQEAAAAVVKHLKEIKYIEERNQRKLETKLAEDKARIDSKLKPKGESLLTNK